MNKTVAQTNIEYLYHYQRFEKEYIEDLILNSRIKFSNPRDFNDPWDCRPSFSKTSLDDPEIYKAQVDYAIDIQRRLLKTPEHELAMQAAKLLSNREYMEASLDECTLALSDTIEENYRVYCLSSKPDNFLMWAHYTNSHKGICFGFKTRSDSFCGAMEVNYSKMYPQIAFNEGDECGFLRGTLLTKAEDWSYEDEYRLIAKEKNSENFLSLEEGYLTFEPSDLVKVIVGCQVLPEDILAMKEIVGRSSSSIELLQVRPAADRYSLILHTL